MSSMIQDEVIKFFCDRLIAIKVGHKDGIIVASATLYAHDDDLYLLTAGHVITEIGCELKKFIEKGVPHNIFLYDVFGTSPLPKMPVAFYSSWYKNNKFLNSALDIGAIKLDARTAHLLILNQIKPFVAQDCIYDDTDDPIQAYFMMGFPVELCHPHPEPVLVTIKRLPDEDRRLVGRIQVKDSLNSIKGMSGGPIIGLHQSGRYTLQAIQSAWVSNTKEKIFGSLALNAFVLFNDIDQHDPSQFVQSEVITNALYLEA